MSDTLRLFLIEDEDDVALLVRKSLERAGHQVTRCRTAADALIVLAHSTFDLVVLDQRLPDMHGVDLLQALGREGISVPVMMVTRHGDEQLAAQVLRAGALDYLTKDRDLAFLNELPKRVEDAVLRYRLQHANRLLIEALESARDGILITDLQGSILHLNQALERMTGYTRQELLGQTPSALYGGGVSGQGPASWAEFQETLCNTVLARQSWQGECSVRRKDQGTLEVSLTVSPIVAHQGQLTHHVAILRDVSERKHLERQLLQAQKLQSVGTLAGGVAHEFNNLLAGISGYAALGLREPGCPADVRGFLQHIVDLSERAALLTRQMLTFARKPALVRRPTPLADLLATTADLITRTLHLEIEREVAPPADGEPLVALADANQLQQALVNLSLNARDALVQRLRAERGPAAVESPGALPALVFRLRHVMLAQERTAWPQNVPPGDYAAVEVIDQGCGMTEKVLNQALDPFFTTKEVGQGTGLGLPMVFGIIQGHHGFLTITSAPDRGTSVGLYLPRRLTRGARDDLPPSFEVGQVLEPESTPGRSILVVDDEEAVQDVVRRFLEIAGHRVTCVASGTEAVELVSRGRAFDLVILDLMMPREDGVTTFQRLRQRRPHLPVLLCTGLPQADPAPHLLEAGAAGLLRKPFRMNELWYAVKQALTGGPNGAPRGA